MKTSANDAVYPSIDETSTYENNRNEYVQTDFIGKNDITKREHFAAMAMQGIIAS